MAGGGRKVEGVIRERKERNTEREGGRLNVSPAVCWGKGSGMKTRVRRDPNGGGRIRMWRR